jgi:hypothetical protein
MIRKEPRFGERETLTELEATVPAVRVERGTARGPAAAADETPSAVAVLALLPVCGTGRIEALDGDGEVLRLAFGREVVSARRDPTLHPLVLRGAFERGERVLAEHRADEGWVVVGALRTQPSPGIDVASEYTIEADRVHIRARSELSLTARAASVVLRAVGEVETCAERILSRAEGLHKIVGRMLRLN